MTKPVPGIKFPFFLADQYPVVEGLRCVEILIPDTIENMALLAGLLKLPGRSFNWTGADQAKRYALAESWRIAYDTTDWDQCMNCEELQACLQPLLDAQTQQILELVQNINNYGTENPGQPMTTGQLTENLAGTSNPECDHDILWAQCLAIIQYTNQAIVDTLEKVEAANNVSELVGLTGEIPFLGLIATQLGIEGVAETVNYFQEAIEDQYLAQYTEPVEVELACQLFCICRDDCVVSIDRVFGMFAGNVAALVPDEPTDLLELVEIIAGVDFDDTEVVNIMMWFAWAGAKVAQFFVGEALASGTLQLLLKLAVNDANNDWELLCTSCPDLLLRVYRDFDRAVLKYEIDVTYGVPFDIEVDPATWGSNEFFAVWGAAADYAYTVEEGSYTGTIAEFSWAYIEPDDDVITGEAPQPATDLPTPGTAKGIFMNANESDTTTHVVRITLTAP